MYRISYSHNESCALTLRLLTRAVSGPNKTFYFVNSYNLLIRVFNQCYIICYIFLYLYKTGENHIILFDTLCLQ